MSPLQLESRIQAFENQFTKKWSSQKFYLWIGILVGCLCLLLTYPLWNQQMPGWSRFFILQDHYWGGIVLFVGFILSLLIPKKLNKFYFPMIITASWIIPCLMLHIYRPFIIVPVGYLGLQALLLLRPRVTIFQKVGTALAVLGSFVLMVWYLGYDAEQTKSYNLFRLFWTSHIEILAIFFFAYSFHKEPMPLATSLNPLQLFFPMPWPESLKPSSSEKRLQELRVSGFMRLFISEITIIILLIVVPHLPTSPEHGGSILHYLAFLLFISGGLGLVAGFLRAFGYEAPDATYFLMFAKSPLEIWQRGSTYMADFLFKNVFFPTWKLSRKIWLASLALLTIVFFHLYFFHDFFLREFLRWLSPSLPIQSATNDQVFLMPALWILCWLCWMSAFHFSTRSFRFFKTSQGLWLAVIITHLGSSQMMTITRWAAAYLGHSID